MSRDPIEFSGDNEEASEIAVDYPDKFVIETKSGTERGLLPNTRYAVRTRAVNNLGVTSEWSDALEFDTSQDTTIPAPVENAMVTADNTTGNITLRWDKVDTNEDGSALFDFAYYEVVFEDPVNYPVYGVLPPFTYSSITESYTFLNSTNKAIHAPYEEGATLDWNITIYATDYSGNRSVPTYINLTEDDWDAYDPSAEPITLQSANYDGVGGVTAHDANEGWRIEVGGKAEYEDLRVNGELWANGINVGKPPIFHGSRRTSDPSRTVANDDVDTVPVVVRFNNTIDVYDTGWDEVNVCTYDSPWITINVDGWYKVTIVHRWTETVLAGTAMITGTRQSMVTLNASYPSGTGGLTIPMGAHGGSFPDISQYFNMFTDTVILQLNEGYTLLPRVYHNAGDDMDLEYFEINVELVSY